MSTTYISVELRRRVTERANNSCEYCLVPLLFGLATSYHIDHVISEKHKGETVFENLALSCPACNMYKGSDLAAYLANEEVIVRLYHPRKDKWSDHFKLETNGELASLSNVGEGTIQLLNLNDSDYCELRCLLIQEGIKLVPNTK